METGQIIALGSLVVALAGFLIGRLTASKKDGQQVGVILTKLDGTAKGGIIVAISQSLGIPVKFVGVGEQVDDLLEFDADQFVHALFE